MAIGIFCIHHDHIVILNSIRITGSYGKLANAQNIADWVKKQLTGSS